MASTSSSVPAPRLQLATVENQMWPIIQETTLLIEYAPSPISFTKEVLDKLFAMPGVQTAFDAAKKRLDPTGGEAVVLAEVHLIGAFVLEEGTGQEFEVTKIQFISTLEEEGKVLVHWPIWHKPQIQKKSRRAAIKKQGCKSTSRRAAANVATESDPDADQDQQKPSKPVSNKRKHLSSSQKTDANEEGSIEDLDAGEVMENRRETKRMKPMNNEAETENAQAPMNQELQNVLEIDETRANKEESIQDSNAKEALETEECEGLENQREPEQMEPTDNGIEIDVVSTPKDQQLQNVYENDEIRANQDESLEDSKAEEAVATVECEVLEYQREPMNNGIGGENVRVPMDQVVEESHETLETLREQIRMLQAENAEKDKKLEDYQYMNEVQQIIDRSSNVLYMSQKKAFEERVRDLESQLEVATEDNAKMVDVYNETTSTFDAQWLKLKKKYEQAKTKKENLKAENDLLRNQLNASEAKRDELSRKVGTLLIEKEELSKQNINKQAMINHGVNVLANHVALVNKLSADLYFNQTGIVNNAPLFQM